MTPELEKGLVKLVNEEYDYGFDLEEGYQKMNIDVYNESILTDILTKCKFKDIGNIYDYPDVLPQQDMIDGFSLAANYDFFERIAVSENFESVVYYTLRGYMITAVFLIHTDTLKKMSKIIHKVTQRDVGSNLFREVDFKCKKGEFIEIGESSEHTKPASVVKKKVPKENLVFDEDSTIFKVINEVRSFFTKEDEKRYEKMQIPYKRGAMLHGEPGNGKTTMSRMLIREIPDVTKILIHPNVRRITKILAVLMKALEGRKAIIIIEDIDSLITDSNRSEFLNILDGVEVRSGIFIIGSTNYLDKIDPAFINRPGRFDLTYHIENPSEKTRRMFYQSRNIGELLAEFRVHKDASIPDSDDAVVELFTKASGGFPMAVLKELMVSTMYLLTGFPNMSIEEAVEQTSEKLRSLRKEHSDSHRKFKRQNRGMAIRPMDDDEWDDEDDDD